MNIIIIKGGSFDEPNSAYAQLRQSLEKFFEVGNLADRLEHQPPNAGLKQTASRRSTSSLRRPGLQRQQTGVSGITDIVGHDNGERPGGYGLVIDGASLRHAFEEPYTKDLLLELATRCKAVICCRTSPLQKALIVRLVKDGLGIMSLAIGDGANDVSMIQAADIGVGVAGEEGLQAVNSSDYAIAQFRYLQRLVLVHGHWSYMRNSTMIVNFFYKEIIGIGILFFFQFYCGYSATTVYEYVYLLLWNIVWTLRKLESADRSVPSCSPHCPGQSPSSSLASLTRTSRTVRSFKSPSCTTESARASSLAFPASPFTCSTVSTNLPSSISCWSTPTMSRRRVVTAGA